MSTTTRTHHLAESSTRRATVIDGGGLDGPILSIWAHPDDETYLAGATMAAAADAGVPVTCVTATLGERGTPDAAAWPPHRLGQLRAWEAAAAMAVLGITDHRCLGLPDGELDGSDAVGIEQVSALLDELDPGTILTFAPDGATFHPDHIAVHRWVVAAWERSGRRARLLCAAMSQDHHQQFHELYEEWGVYMSDERPQPPDDERLAVRVTARGRALDRKLAALAAMASQTRAAADLLGDRYAAMAADECFVDATEVGIAPALQPA